MARYCINQRPCRTPRGWLARRRRHQGVGKLPWAGERARFRQPRQRPQRDFCNPGQGDAADRQDGSVRRGGDFFQLGNTRGSGSRLRRGRINRAKNQVVHRPHGRDLSERVNGGADHPSAGRDASQPYRIERITAKVSAMGTCCSATSARSLMITFAGVAASIIRRASRVSTPPSRSRSRS